MNDIYNATKTIFRYILKYYLKYITKLVLFIHKPFIIAVSGSINVAFTKEEIKRQLVESGYEVMSNPKNFNTEIGLPLAILNLPSGYSSFKNWLLIIFSAFKSIFILHFPKILVLGLGVSSPGDMKYLMSLIKPDMAVVTDITQRYLESFNDMDNLVGEYEVLAGSLKKNGCLVLNCDNHRVKNLANKIKKGNKIYLFGLKEKCSDINYWQGKIIRRADDGQIINITDGNKIFEYKINRFGEHHIYSALSGAIAKNVFSLK